MPNSSPPTAKTSTSYGLTQSTSLLSTEGLQVLQPQPSISNDTYPEFEAYQTMSEADRTTVDQKEAREQAARDAIYNEAIRVVEAADGTNILRHMFWMRGFMLVHKPGSVLVGH